MFVAIVLNCRHTSDRFNYFSDLNILVLFNEQLTLSLLLQKAEGRFRETAFCLDFNFAIG